MTSAHSLASFFLIYHQISDGRVLLSLRWLSNATTLWTRYTKGHNQWCIAKNGCGYMQWGVAKGLKVPCLFMITEVSIRCQKNPGGWYTPYTPQYTTGHNITQNAKRQTTRGVITFICTFHGHNSAIVIWTPFKSQRCSSGLDLGMNSNSWSWFWPWNIKAQNKTEKSSSHIQQKSSLFSN